MVTSKFRRRERRTVVSTPCACYGHLDDETMILSSHNASHGMWKNGENQKAAALWRECWTLQEFRSMLNDTLPNEQRPSVLRRSPIAATAALKRMTQLWMVVNKKVSSQPPLYRQEQNTMVANASMESSWSVCKEALPILLDPILKSLALDPAIISPAWSTRQLDLLSTVDCLVSLSLLISCGPSKAGSPSNVQEALAPVLLLLWGKLQDWQESSPMHMESSSTMPTEEANVTLPTKPLQLSPRRLIRCLRAVQPYPDATSSDLYRAMVERLCQGDAQARLDAADLVTLLGLAHLDDTSSYEGRFGDATLQSKRPELRVALDRLIVRCARRLRKQKVRESASIPTLVRAMIRARQLYRDLAGQRVLSEATEAIWNDATTDDSADDCNLQRELRIVLFTLTNQLVRPRSNETSMEGRQASGSVQRLSAAQVAIVCDTMRSVLELNATHPLVATFCQDVIPDHAHNWNEAPPSLQDIARILSALEHWRMVNGTTQLVYTLGRAFEAQIANGDVCDFKPRDVNTILRCGALLGSNESTMTPFLVGAKHLLASSDFLSFCGPSELANFGWFAAFKAHGNVHGNDDVVLALGHRILDQEVASLYSPKQACRILNAFTALCSNSAEGEDSPRTELLADLFERLGEHLLASHLSPLDASSAIYSYAKASYVLDMGIFDHLVGIVASQLTQCSIRQVAQTLWSCGKMIAFESFNTIDEDRPNDETYELPPYATSATQLVTFLSHHSDQLSSKDVAQTLWAMSRLGMNDIDIWTPILNRVREVAPDLTNQERANLLWALRKMPITDSKVIFALTRPFALASFADTSVSSQAIKPQEASNILYALGHLNIRDVDVFRYLTHVILLQVDSASAQSVANVLWAHRAVHIEPPRQLLENWASRRLPGLVFAHDLNADYPSY
jgi:hypothetical protein